MLDASRDPTGRRDAGFSLWNIALFNFRGSAADRQGEFVSAAKSQAA
jgi:hypothetical protein